MKRSALAVILLGATSSGALAQHQTPAPAGMTAQGVQASEMLGEAQGSQLARELENAILNGQIERLSAGGFDDGVHRLIRQSYVNALFEPVWTQDGLRNLARAANDLESTGVTGVDSEMDLLPELADRRFNSASAQDKAHADIELTLVAARLASLKNDGLADEGGTVRAENGAPQAELVTAIRAAGQGEASDFLHRSEGEHPQYRRLKETLGIYREIADQGGWLAIPDGENVDPGMSDPRIPALRERLKQEGYEVGAETIEVEAEEPQTRGFIEASLGNDTAEAPTSSTPETVADPTLYDENLEDALRNFQRRHGIEDDGVIGPKTLSALNESVVSKIRRIEDSMERWQAFGPVEGRYVLANIPSYTAEAWDGAERQLSMKTVVGMPSRATPLFSDEVEYVVSAPRWYAPTSIVRKDKLPKLARDPGYAERGGYRIYSRATGERVSAYSVNWNDPSAANRYQLVQQPGRSNALGELKIIFPNEHAVYMHGTPSEYLFNREERAASSGCIRLERPKEMAAWIAEASNPMLAEQVSQAVEARKHQRIDYSAQVPVHLTYHTVTVGDDGLPYFWRDIYNRAGGTAEVSKTAPLYEAPETVQTAALTGAAP